MATPLSTEVRRYHRKFAVDTFNRTWGLLLKKRRGKADDLRMIHMAHASRYHWGLVGTPKHMAIGEWQVSHVYAVLGQAESAVFHATACLDLCRKHRVGDFPLAYAYEALARASALVGNKRDVTRYLRLGIQASESIREDDDRALFLKDLRTVPGSRAVLGA